VLVCTLVLTIGMVAIAGLLAVTAQMQIGARESARSTRLAQAKIDNLALRDFETDLQMAVGGSVVANVANHNEAATAAGVALPGITLRWVVANGPTEDTRVVTVRVVNLRAQQYRNTDVTTILREW
jgi:hypothetical protein